MCNEEEFDPKRLRVEEQTVFVCDYFEMERFIKEHYPNLPKTWNLLAQQEWPNDSYHHYHIVKEKLESYDQDDLEEFKKSGEGAGLHVILTDLCNRNELNPGIYVVHVCW